MVYMKRIWIYTQVVQIRPGSEEMHMELLISIDPPNDAATKSTATTTNTTANANKATDLNVFISIDPKNVCCVITWLN